MLETFASVTADLPRASLPTRSPTTKCTIPRRITAHGLITLNVVKERTKSTAERLNAAVLLFLI